MNSSDGVFARPAHAIAILRFVLSRGDGPKLRRDDAACHYAPRRRAQRNPTAGW